MALDKFLLKNAKHLHNMTKLAIIVTPDFAAMTLCCYFIYNHRLYVIVDYFFYAIPCTSKHISTEHLHQKPVDSCLSPSLLAFPYKEILKKYVNRFSYLYYYFKEGVLFLSWHNFTYRHIPI